MPRRGSSCSAEGSAPRQPVGAWPGARPTLAAMAIVLTVMVALVALVSPAAAEPPGEVAEELAVDGVYVAEGRDDVDEAAVAAAVDEARALGLRVVAVAPNEPEPSPGAFARRVQEASDADAAIVFPPGGGFEAHVIDELQSSSLRATEAARSKSSPVAAVEAFSAELLTEPERGFPPIIRQVLLAVLLLVILLAGAVVAEQYLRRASPDDSRPAGRILLDGMTSTMRRPPQT